MELNDKYVYCISTVSNPEVLLTNDNDEVLIFDNEEQITDWIKKNNFTTDNFVVHTVEVIFENE